MDDADRRKIKADTEALKIMRKLDNARREIVKAVERSAKVDLLAGHKAEAIRRTEAARDAADEAIRAFEAPEERR